MAQAEAKLYAAHANVDAARAAFFPSLGLTGAAGYGLGRAGAACSARPTSPGASAPRSLQTIFDGGRIHAQNDLALAQQQELVATYRKTVFTAFSDVETALGTVQCRHRPAGA